MHQAWVIDVKMKMPGRGVVRVRETSPINTRRGAQQYEHRLRAAILDGTHEQQQIQAVPTFSAFLPKYLTYCSNNNKFSTFETKKRLIELHLAPFFGTMVLDDIGPADIEEFKALMRSKLSSSRKTSAEASKWAVLKRHGAPAETLSPKTVNNTLTCLRKMLAVAQEQGVIEHIPRVKLFKVNKPDFDFLAFDEAERLIDATDNDSRAAVLVAVKAGLRLGEILALQWSDLDLVKGRVVVRRNFWRGHLNETPKGGRTRSVDLPGSLITALKAHRHVKGPWVFCSAKGHPLTDKQLNGLLSKAVRRAGIARDEGRIGWHDLRHTYGSHLAMRAVPLRTIQELMGHATIEMTMRYAHLSPEITRDAVKQLDEAAPGAHAGHKEAVVPISVGTTAG
jgi:integrase